MPWDRCLCVTAREVWLRSVLETNFVRRTWGFDSDNPILASYSFCPYNPQWICAPRSLHYDYFLLSSFTADHLFSARQSPQIPDPQKNERKGRGRVDNGITYFTLDDGRLMPGTEDVEATPAGSANFLYIPTPILWHMLRNWIRHLLQPLAQVPLIKRSP